MVYGLMNDDLKNPSSNPNSVELKSDTQSAKDDLATLQNKIEDKVEDILTKEGVTGGEISGEKMQEAIEQIYKMILEQMQQLDKEQDIEQVLNNLLSKKFVRLSPEVMKKAINSVKFQVGKFSQKMVDNTQQAQQNKGRSA